MLTIKPLRLTTLWLHNYISSTWMTMFDVCSSNHTIQRRLYIFRQIFIASTLYKVHISTCIFIFIAWKLILSCVPVSLYCDHLASSLQSQKLNFFTKPHWHHWKLWNPWRQVALDSLIMLSLRPFAFPFDHQCALNELSIHSYCAVCALSVSK